MDNYLSPNHPVRSIITGPSECGKSVLLTNLILKIINEYEKIYIYSPSLHQDLYQKLIKCFTNYIPIHIIPNILNEEDIDIVIEEIVHNIDFEKSDTKIETYESIEELKITQDFEDGGFFIVGNLNEKKLIEYKQCLKDLDITIYLFSFFLKIITSYQNDLLEQMEISTTSSKQTIWEMLKISIKIKQAWI